MYLADLSNLSIYCVLIFVGHLITCICEYDNPRIKDPNEILIHCSNIAYNMIFTNLSVHEHVQCRQTTKFRAHEIK